MNVKEPRIERRLVYGIVHDSYDSLVFIPKRKADKLAHLWSVLQSAKTWGELRVKLPRTTVREIREMYMGGETQRTGVLESAPFDWGEIGAIWGGFWPEWPQQTMLDFMPEEIIKEFGTSCSTIHVAVVGKRESSCQQIPQRHCCMMTLMVGFDKLVILSCRSTTKDDEGGNQLGSPGVSPGLRKGLRRGRDRPAAEALL